jgi:hypothetical protein
MGLIIGADAREFAVRAAIIFALRKTEAAMRDDDGVFVRIALVEGDVGGDWKGDGPTSVSTSACVRRLAMSRRSASAGASPFAVIAA